MPTKVKYTDDYYDDGMDEPLSTYPTTDYPTEDYAEDEEEAAAAAVSVSYASDEQRRKEMAAGTRKAMREADEKRSAEVAETHAAAAWLAQRGLATDGLDAEATRRLHQDLKQRGEALAKEFDAIASEVESALINRDERRVHVSGPRCFFIATASWSYPTLTGENVTVDSNDRVMRGVVMQLANESARRGSAGFFTSLVKLLAELAVEVDAEAADVWHRDTGERLTLKSTRRKLAIQLTPVQREALEARQVALQAASERARAAQRLRNPTATRSTARLPTGYHGAFTAADYARVSHADDVAFDAEIAQRARDDAAVRMADNRFNQIPMLNITDMPLVIAPPALATLAHVTVLNLHNCHLRHVPNLGAMKLQKLYLSHNQIDTVSDTVFDAYRKNLRVLDLSNNRIDTLPDGMTALTRLEVLQLEYNRIKRMCDVSKWPRLEVLELTDNCLRQLPVAVARLERLWRLRVGANPLENLPAEIFYQGLAKVKEYLCELTPTNLPVARPRLAEDIVAQCDPTSPDAWCDVEIVAGATRRVVPSYLLEARLPGLTKGATVLPAQTCDDGRRAPTHRVELPARTDPTTVDGLVRLLNATLEMEHIAEDPMAQVQLSEIVSAHGSNGLMTQLTSVLRGHDVDATEVLADDLAGLAMHTSNVALGAATDDGAAAAEGVFRVGDVVTVVVGPLRRRFVAHRGLLAARCPFFANLFRSGLSDANAPEVALEETDPDVFAAFLTYAYADSASKLSPDNVAALLFLAVEFNVQRLRDLCEAMVGFNVDVDNVAQVIQLAYFLDSTRLKNACMYFVHSNYAAVRCTEGYHQLQDEVKKELADKLAKWNSSK